MPLFISEDEFERFKTSNDVSAVAEKADSYIRDLFANLETVKAEADAAAITAEQTCSLLEHKYLSLSSEFSALESRYSQLDSNLQQRNSELAQVQSDKHQLHIKVIEKDGEIERLSTEVKELQKSKRQVLELVGAKDAEISEKNATLNSYFDKITSLTDRASQREARLSELEAEMVRCKANCDKLLQEKELIEKHNTWLNDELTMKVDTLLEQRRKAADMEAEYSMKLADLEKQYSECSSSLSRHKERVRELESKTESLHRELCSARDDSSAAEQRYSTEISTVSKLADLYKESSEEWSKKAGELEGVIKALETHLSQVENNYKEKLEMETAARKEAEKVSGELKEKLEKCEAELESSRRSNELEIFPFSSYTTGALTYSADANNASGDDVAIVPHVPAGVSGTALAASLLRDGWSLEKMYAKYQEAADALRFEQLGRKQTQAILERVLLEIEEKASAILNERAEQERMAEAYASMNQKLQKSFSEQGNLEKIIRELKADLKKRERENNHSQKEVKDLQTQVAILLKECSDVQLRRALKVHEYVNDDIAIPSSREAMQNAKIEAENLHNLLKERELEALKKDIELQRKEEHLEKKISDVLERSQNIDVDDYHRLKSVVEQLRVSLKEKDIVIEKNRKELLQKEEVTAKLELDLSQMRSELTKRDNRLSQVEASLKSDAEKQKRALLPYKRKINLLNSEKDALSKEKESLLKEKESLVKEKESLSKEMEKRAVLPKSIVETRKTGRQLVQSQLKTEEPQRDVEMSELDGKNVGKPNLAAHSIVPVSSEVSIGKRPASPSPSDMLEESFLAGDINSDLPAPALKRSKGSEPTSHENVEPVPTVEELLVAEDSDVTDGNEQIVRDTEHTNEAPSSTEVNVSCVESAITREDSSSVTTGQEVANVSTSSTTINLTERARERKAVRLGRSPGGKRGRRPPITRSRGGRTSRGGRRQSSGDQGQS